MDIDKLSAYKIGEELMEYRYVKEYKENETVV